MRVKKDDDNKIQVRVIRAMRDVREKVDGKVNADFGKMKYETVKTIEVYDAEASEVATVIGKALDAASATPTKK